MKVLLYSSFWISKFIQQINFIRFKDSTQNTPARIQSRKNISKFTGERVCIEIYDINSDLPCSRQYLAL